MVNDESYHDGKSGTEREAIYGEVTIVPLFLFFSYFYFFKNLVEKNLPQSVGLR